MLEYFMTNRISEFFLLHQSIFTTNNLTCKPEADIESAVAMATLQILPSCMNFSDRKLFKTQLSMAYFCFSNIFMGGGGGGGVAVVYQEGFLSYF